jgi:hypothetical protein
MKTMFGLWALLPYLHDSNLLIENEEEVILQVFETESNDLEQIAVEILSDSSNKTWYTTLDTPETQTRRLDYRDWL